MNKKQFIILKPVSPQNIIEGTPLAIEAFSRLIGANYLMYKPTKVEVGIVTAEGELKWEPFTKLLRSYPPYTPLPHKGIFEYMCHNGIMINGAYLWTISTDIRNANLLSKIKENIIRSLRNTNVDIDYSLIKCDKRLLCGIYTSIGDFIIPKIILPINVIKDLPAHYLVVSLNTYDGNYNIIYGYLCLTQEIARTKKRNVSIDDICSEIEKASTRYSLSQLTYITVCKGGYVLVNDPQCLELNNLCYKCKHSMQQRLCRKSPGYGYYYYRMEEFPKINTNIDVKLALPKELIEAYDSPYTVTLFEDKPYYVVATSVELRVPVFNKIIIKDLKPMIASPRGYTNGILLLIHKNVINAFVDMLRYKPNNAACCSKVLCDGRAIPLIDLLALKYILYNTDIFNSEILFDSKSKRLILNVKIKSLGSKKMKIMYKEDTLKYVNDTYNEFIDFVAKVILHSLAHLLFIDIVEKIGIEEDDILYTYTEEPRYNIYYLALMENSKYANLRLDQEIRSIFSHMDKNAIKVKEDLEKSITTKIEKDLFSRYLEDSIKRLLDTYNEYVETVNKSICPNLENVINTIIKNACLKLSLKDINRDHVFSFTSLITRKFITMLRDLLQRLPLDKSTLKFMLAKLLYEINENKHEALIDYLINEVNESHIPIEKIKDIVRRIIYSLKDDIDNILDVIMPDDCIDGCSIDLYLGRACKKVIEETITVSRCTLTHFLRFLGLRINNADTFFVNGEIIQRLIDSATRSVYILTAYTSKAGIDALANLLSRGINVSFCIDKSQFKYYESDLRELMKRFSGNFKVFVTSKAEHGKLIIIDNAILHTSWNYGTSIHKEQVLRISIANDDEVRKLQKRLSQDVCNPIK